MLILALVHPTPIGSKNVDEIYGLISEEKSKLIEL